MCFDSPYTLVRKGSDKIKTGTTESRIPSRVNDQMVSDVRIHND